MNGVIIIIIIKIKKNPLLESNLRILKSDKFNRINILIMNKNISSMENSNYEKMKIKQD